MNNRPFEGKHILVLEGYTKQSLPFIGGFKKLGCEVSVLCGTKWDCAYWSRYADHKILGLCDLHKTEESEKYIVEGIEHNIEINHATNKFIPDGIVNPVLWQDSEHKKILYIFHHLFSSRNLSSRRV